MAYQVFDSGKTADETGYPQLKGCGWIKSKFDTVDDAVEYAHMWLNIYSPGKEHLISIVGKQEGFDYNGYDVIQILEVD